MIASQANDWRELDRLIDGLCDQTLSADERTRLGQWLVDDVEARDHYLTCLELHGRVAWHIMPGKPLSPAELHHYTEAECDGTVPIFVSAKMGLSRLTSAPQPVVGFLGAFHGTVGYLSSGWPAAYLVATVICGLGIFIGALVHVSKPTQVARQFAPLPSHLSPRPSSSPFVGRITGMVDCQWVQSPESRVQSPALDSRLSTLVSLGDTFALSSGLMEITYDTGAKVILQGPATYEVESAAGGYLSVGRLTAKVEKKGHNLPSPARGRGAGGEGREPSGDRSQPQTALTLALSKEERGPGSRSSFLIPHSYFAVRTPTATVTDLGTEFGVEVGPQNGTRVCVLQGHVALRSASSGASQETILQAGQASQVDGRGAIVQRSETDAASFAGTFIRRLPRQDTPTVVALADLVAGGTGFGSRSDWGIDPRDASVVVEHFGTGILSSGKYERYSGMPQIDGVFIPNGADGPVQVDSAGHMFSLPATSGTSCGPIWVTKGSVWMGPPANPRLVVRLHANAGITFDLQAIQAAASGRRVVRFQTAIAYRPQMKFDPRNKADVWVLIDGQLRFSRGRLCDADGLVVVDILLERTDQFLTLIATEGDDGPGQDHLQWLDPRVVLEAKVDL